MSTADHVFHQLSHIFSTRRGRILEFELLPAGVGSLLQDGCSVGISKDALAQCFIIARQVFFDSALKDVNPGSTTVSPDQVVDYNKLSISSQIILLFDCEHLTACNWRKRRLASTIQAHDFSTAGHAEHEDLIQQLEFELTLMTTYLTSPLHRHTKSPTLWQHRLWVMSHILRVQGLEPTGRIMTQSDTADYRTQPARPGIETVRELFIAELDVVQHAGELHPKNYYAFSYIRELHRMLANAVGVDSGFAELARSLVTASLNWCLSHPRDISGWMFLLYLLDAIQDGQVTVESVKTVVQFALDVGWDGEGLWTFVDMAALKFGLVETIQDMLQSHSGTTTMNSAMSRLSIHETAVPGQQWKKWVASVRAYWDAGGL
ncbi:hypothetical protein PHISCL_02148 [Aspergillus sclerotialis]|uniref:Uncharacterized protein n=1 Tax=Aspergillus sclerotialis TaxID=2070753 RepID=A0A3A2ZR99_9EURO|nr:hypothetical protein PHISCL_02148 [Aspergillus sclerotialis]